MSEENKEAFKIFDWIWASCIRGNTQSMPWARKNLVIRNQFNTRVARSKQLKKLVPSKIRRTLLMVAWLNENCVATLSKIEGAKTHQVRTCYKKVFDTYSSETGFKQRRVPVYPYGMYG